MRSSTFRIPRPRLAGLSSSLVLTAVIAIGLVSFWGSAPYARISDPLIDIGTVGRGELLQRSIVITNRGLRALQLPPFARTCGISITIDPSSQTLARGGTVPLKVDIDTTLFAEGPSVKEVGITTNDPLRRTLILAVKADVRSDVTTSSTLLRVSPETPRAAAELRVKPGSGVKLIGIRTTHPRVSARLDEAASPEGPVYTVHAQADNSAPLPWSLGNVIVQTTSSLMPEVRLPVRGTMTNEP